MGLTLDSEINRDAVPSGPAGRDAAPDAGTYEQFLNHELRTPLTAAGAALQTLERELRGRDEQSAVLGLVRVALRNLERLERTVEWVGDYAAGQQPAGTPAEHADLLELIEDLDELDVPAASSWQTGDGDWSGHVAIARDDWRRLLRQTARAFHFLAPGAPLDVTVEMAGHAAAGRELSVVFRLADPAAALASAVDRTGRSAVADPVARLRDLVAVNVSPELWPRLGARHEIVPGGGTPSLRLRVVLPAAVAAS